MLPFAFTIALGAFLLFQIQPIIAHQILPWFGGSAAVWTTCLVFFQTALVAGYLYAHLLTRRLSPRRQMLVHLALLGTSLLVLPIALSPAWKPADAASPALRIVLLLAATVGLPYFTLAATSPLVQAWRARQHAGPPPYRLFALSNLGSLVALLAYPFVVEPLVSGRWQTRLWSAGYAVFALACAAVAWRAGHGEGANVGARSSRAEPDAPPPPRASAMLFWLALSGCASLLLISVTHDLTQNIAPIPLLWVLPLALYLLSFVLCFESERIYRRWLFLPLVPPALAAAQYVALDPNAGHGRTAIAIVAAGFFVCVMVCHGELARRRPGARHLTSFYLMIAVGGALGGLMSLTVAPFIYPAYWEDQFALVACAALVTAAVWNAGADALVAPVWPRVVRGLFGGITLSMAAFALSGGLESARSCRLMLRNFYGVLRVRDQPEQALRSPHRVLLNGNICHGLQRLDAAHRREPNSYFGPNSGVGRAIQLVQSRGPARIGIVGLGAGVLASYGRAGDLVQFYEINPLVERLATTEFTYLADCAADHPVLLGDARLTMERQPDQRLDLLAIDAFSSDAIPTHLLTAEAFALYLRHLKKDGLLAVHISNRYVDLAPVVAANAAQLGRVAALFHDDGADDPMLSPSTWVLVAADRATLYAGPLAAGAPHPVPLARGFRPWTDDRSDLLGVLR